MELNLYSSLGLIIDIIGVIFIFRYGLPSKVNDHGGGIGVVETDENKANRMKQNTKIRRKAYIGFVLLLIGFVLQLIGTNYVVIYYVQY